MDTIHLWLQAHPLTAELFVGIVILFVTPLVTPVVNTFWAFCSIPPQRFGKWLLKARLERAESERRSILRMRDETPHLIFACLRCLGLFMTWIQGTVLSSILTTTPGPVHESFFPITSYHSLGLAFGVMSLVALSLSNATYSKINHVIHEPDQRVRKITARITAINDRLKARAPAPPKDHK